MEPVAKAFPDAPLLTEVHIELANTWVRENIQPLIQAAAVVIHEVLKLPLASPPPPSPLPNSSTPNPSRPDVRQGIGRSCHICLPLPFFPQKSSLFTLFGHAADVGK
ncbi:unnamed protein product [Rodentolepis nana]|uniref:Uncharacterized protein n=1 Tax=Rodentolepis nana TaxID=102285 RepID=A0A0R3TL27_RODNA|nr:unnamed protein product [Rodentolepis nana]